MRLIDAEAFKRQIAAAAVQNGTEEAANKASIMVDLVDNQPTAINGRVIEAEYTYQRIAYVRPMERHYEKPEETPYIKYCCPVCEALGNPHQVIPNQANCSLCNINLNWEN
ncbi:hypothetical protein [Lacrimispora indolis]|uniref:hypothetical protein n=1 Tax=Lacrimispora indolis TaxID=69825 RepID=UPI000462B6F0|nr:hypothetical protein [[Clostridium] methoxybenzovorans]